jgi:cardiolipin synthase
MKQSRAIPTDREKGKTTRLLLPSAITGIRLAIFPFLILTLGAGMTLVADLLFLAAIATDLTDGYMARILGVSTEFGRVFDATVDFLFIGGMFLNFTIVGIFPIWVFLLVVLMFVQFAATSLFYGVIFDPIGKYYGSLLYGGIGLTILFPTQTATNLIISAFAVVTATCVLSRIIFLRKSKPK